MFNILKTRWLGWPLFVSLWLLSSCGSSPITASSERPAHHTEEGFRNLYVEPSDKTIFSYLKMRYLGDEPFADQPANAHKVPVVATDPEALRGLSDKPIITWLGHSTFLIQHQGVTILTDPILSERASPVSFAGPQRLVAMPVKLDDLPSVDYVVISHNHYDHLDADTIAALGNQAKYLVPLKIGELLQDLGIAEQQIVELDWWESFSQTSMTATATPSQHWSGRGLFDRNETLWAAWYLDINGFTLWFGGDTGYNDKIFKQVGERWQGVDLGLIPIGAYAPRWFMKAHHVNPFEAVDIHNDIQARSSIGMHWGTFQLTAEPIDEPVRLLDEAVAKGMVKRGQFMTLAIGERVEFDLESGALLRRMP